MSLNNNWPKARDRLVCKIPLLARARPNARATIGYLVYKGTGDISRDSLKSHFSIESHTHQNSIETRYVWILPIFIAIWGPNCNLANYRT